MESGEDCDLVKSRARIWLWYAPTATAVVGFLVASVRWPVWTAAFLWAGAACCVNSARCGRVHCAFTGPLYIVLGLLCGSNTAGWTSVGWPWIWSAAVAGTLASFMPEWRGRVYCHAKIDLPEPTQRDAKISSLRRLYSRASLYYDILDWPFEYFRYRLVRRELWKGLSGRILDLGAGTGRNAAYYPEKADVITADLSPEMLAHARRRLLALGRKPRIAVVDALNLDFKDEEFDVCVSTFLFCVLPDELQEQALREVRRVLKPGGKIHLLEYSYSQKPWRRFWMRALSPWVEALYGARFDRGTRLHLQRAGFELTEERYVHSDIILKLVGRKQPGGK